MEVLPGTTENTCYTKENVFYIVTGTHLLEPQLAPLSRAFLKALASGCPHILIDCTSLTNFCTEASRALLNFLRTLSEKRLTLVLFGLKPDLLAKLQESGLADLLTIFQTETEALYHVLLLKK
jgi:anti-anti-sigma regulatory factor